MTPAQWTHIRNFNPKDDNFGNPRKMNYEFILTLDAFRRYIDKPIIVHCGFEIRESGYHPKGIAVDVHVEGMSLFNQFLVAQRFPKFTGIGIYPWWGKPGLHLDARPKKKNQPRNFWGSTGPKKYVKVTKQFLFQTM